MAWVLLADDHLVELPNTGPVVAIRVGDEVPAHLAHGAGGGGQPGIVVGRGAGPGATPAQDEAAFPPTQPELAEIIRFARDLGSRLTRGVNFAAHFRDHKHLLERATGRTYPANPIGEADFLRELGHLLAAGTLRPVGIATINRGAPMAYVYQGQPGPVALTALVRPSGEWITLLASGTGRDLALQYQMRFDGAFPFPFLQLRPHGGFGREWL